VDNNLKRFLQFFNMRWVDVLTVWKYPNPIELSSVLEELGLDPAKYSYPWELAKDLRSLIKGKMIMVRGEWKPLEWYDPILDFFNWLWQQLASFFAPYAKTIVLVGIGGLITWVASGWYRALGAIPIILGIYTLLKDFGYV